MAALVLLLGLGLSMSSSHQRAELYQVVTSHPHELEELASYMETVQSNGRLWIVKLNKDLPAHLQEHLRTITGRENHYAYQGLFITNKNSKGRPLGVTSFTSRVEVQNIRQDVKELSAYETRFVATPENSEALKRTAKRLKNLGYALKEHCYRDEVCSLIAEKKGSSQKNDVLMIMAHIDSVGETYAGADDNASGVAVLLEMARVLKDYPNEKTLRFFVTNGEEAGLIGSSHYARHLETKQEIKNIKFALNMDMVGYNNNGVVEIETSPEFEKKAKELGDIASRFTKLKTKITLGAWGSDHLPFLSRSVPAFMMIQDWETKNPCYHQACDTAELINYEYAAEIAKLNISAILLEDLKNN